MDTATSGGGRASSRRTYVKRDPIHGLPRPQQIDSRAKGRIIDRARRITRERKQARQHGGPISRAALDVLRALLYSFHRNSTGCCFPSHDTIAEIANVARSTVTRSIRILEDHGILRIVRRIKRVIDRSTGEPRVLRTSNAYAFIVPPPPHPPSDVETREANADARSGVISTSLSLLPTAPSKPSPLEEALARMERRVAERDALKGSG